VYHVCPPSVSDRTGLSKDQSSATFRSTLAQNCLLIFDCKGSSWWIDAGVVWPLIIIADSNKEQGKGVY